MPEQSNHKRIKLSDKNALKPPSSTTFSPEQMATQFNRLNDITMLDVKTI